MKWMLFALGLSLSVGAPLGLSLHKQQVLRDGERVFLQLAPVDPRSLMQGDYMALRYDLQGQLGAASQAWPLEGQVVVRLDERGVAEFERLHQGAELTVQERLLDYRKRGERVGARWPTFGFGSSTFLFEEGQAQRFEQAEYGELRVLPDGRAVLVGLVGEDLSPL